MQVAAVQFDIAWEDKRANHDKIELMLDQAGVEPGTFVLLPELGDTGFSFNLDRIVDNATLDWACRIARQRGIWLQPGFARRGPDDRGRNCAAIIDPAGSVRGVYEKVHPFSYGREIEHFSGGESLLLCDVGKIDPDRDAPSPALHPLIFCPLICYDLRFPELWRLGASGGAEAFTIGASWPAARHAHWRALLIARAIENQAWVVAVNRVGSDPHLDYRGGSIIISPRGEVIAEADQQETVLQATIDIEELRRWRKDFPALKDIHPGLLGEIDVHHARVIS